MGCFLEFGESRERLWGLTEIMGSGSGEYRPGFGACTLEYFGQGAKSGEGSLEQVRANESREPQPVGGMKVREQKAQKNKGSGKAQHQSINGHILSPRMKSFPKVCFHVIARFGSPCIPVTTANQRVRGRTLLPGESVSSERAGVFNAAIRSSDFIQVSNGYEVA